MMRKMQSLLMAAFMLLVVACCLGNQPDSYGLAGKTHSAIMPVGRTDKDWWMPRHEQVLERVEKGNADLIFIGDSITHRWETVGSNVWSRYYEPRNAVNMGFGGDRTENVLWRIEHGEVDGISPKLAIVMIGTNNNSHKDSAEQIADGIKTICVKLRQKLPETKILLLAIFPRGGSLEQRDDRAQKEAVMNSYWEKNDKASRMVSEIVDNRNVFFLDINRAFLTEKGALEREIMLDLLHPTEKGYQIWAEAMELTIKKLMGEEQDFSEKQGM